MSRRKEKPKNRIQYSTAYQKYLTNSITKLTEDELWVPFESNGNLYMQGKIQPNGWFLRKGTSVDLSFFTQDKSEAHRIAAVRNKNDSIKLNRQPSLFNQEVE